jgi:hypothetical protein
VIPDPELNIWEHSRALLELTRGRALGLAPEMDASAQAAEILSSIDFAAGTPCLDGGCAAGHFIWSLKKRKIELDYRGLDYSPSHISLGKEIFASLKFDPERLILESLDDLKGGDFPIAVLINVLSFNPDYRRILGRLIENGAETIVLRDNFGSATRVRWETDGYLDPGYNHLKGYWNRWGKGEMEEFLGDLGFKALWMEDRRTRGEVEMVVGKPYTWGFCLARRVRKI